MWRIFVQNKGVKDGAKTDKTYALRADLLRAEQSYPNKYELLLRYASERHLYACLVEPRIENKTGANYGYLARRSSVTHKTGRTGARMIYVPISTTKDISISDTGTNPIEHLSSRYQKLTSLLPECRPVSLPRPMEVLPPKPVPTARSQKSSL